MHVSGVEINAREDIRAYYLQNMQHTSHYKNINKLPCRLCNCARIMFCTPTANVYIIGIVNLLCVLYKGKWSLLVAVALQVDV